MASEGNIGSPDGSSLEPANSGAAVDSYSRRKLSRERLAELSRASEKANPGLKYSVVNPGRCDRGCARCFAGCGPKDAMLDFEYAAKRLRGNATEHLTFTISEPFCYSFETAPGGTKDISDLARHALATNPNSLVEIVTSGIKFFSEFESAVAGKFAAFPATLKNRLVFTLSVNPFPHFNGRTASEVQRESLAYFLKNGFEFHVLNSLQKRDFRESIAIPVIAELEKSGIAVPVPQDLAGLLSGSSVQHVPGSMYTKRQGAVAKGVSIGEDCVEGFCRGDIIPNNCIMVFDAVQLNPDKTISPGCYRFVAPFVRLAEDNEPAESKMEKIRIFRNALNFRCVKNQQKGVCTNCIGLAIELGQVREKARLANLLPGISRAIKI